jgi:predicted transcriptional regulator
MFGAGWVTAMGVKMGSSIVNKKVSSSVAKSVVKEKKFNHLKNYQKLFESTKDTLLKIGDGLKKFFSVLRKFKIAVLIFFGVVFILNLIFDPIFDSILSIANMSHLSDVFSNGFSVPEPTKIPKIDIEKIESEPIKTNINIKLDLGNTGKEYVNNVDETSGELTKSLQTSINDASKNISENPEMARKNVANIVNQLHEEVKNSEPATIEDITTEKANDLDDETIKKDLLDMGTEKNVDDIENIINLDKPEINSSVLNLFKNNNVLLDKDSQDFFNNNGQVSIDGTTNVVTLNNGLKVELDNAVFNMKDGNITNIKFLIMKVTKEDGTKIVISKTVQSGDNTFIFSSSLKPIDGYKEMTYNEYEGKGYGIRADVKDLSEKAYKKIWIKEYEQKDAEDIFKKLGIKDSNSKLESPPTPTPVTKVWDSNLSKDEMSNLDYDIYKKINKMSIEDLKQKYTEIIGSSDKLEENDMKLALAKYSLKNPNYKF